MWQEAASVPPKVYFDNMYSVTPLKKSDNFMQGISHDMWGFFGGKENTKSSKRIKREKCKLFWLIIHNIQRRPTSSNHAQDS